MKKAVISVTVVILILSILMLSCLSASAAYTGNYDLSQPHEVNVYIHDGEALEKWLQVIYQQCIAWGITKEGAAAICGNAVGESSGDPTRVEAAYGDDWGSFIFGAMGIGWFQWTAAGRQSALFDIAYEMGKKWTDPEVQLTDFKRNWVDHFDDKYFTSHDVYELASDFVAVWEAPSAMDSEDTKLACFEQRTEWANECLSKFKDLPAKNYDGVIELGTESSDGGGIDISKGILSEWELTGMPVKSGLTADIGTLSLGDRSDLSATDMVNISSIGDDISLTKTYNAWTTVRVIIVFVGLLMLTYALMLMLALFVDKFNNIFDFSMIGIITFGAIHFSDDKYSSNGEEDVVRTTDTKRMVILIIVIALIGGILVSGGVLPFVLRAVYKVTSAITG